MSNDTWATPQPVFDKLDLEFSFCFDVCAEIETAKHSRFWTIEDDALANHWALDIDDECEGQFNLYAWCNPPYSNITPWVDKAIEAQANGLGTVMLCMCDPSVKWFSKAMEYASEIRFITNGRLAFLKNGVPQSRNNKGSVIFVFDPHRIGTRFTSYVDRESFFSGEVAA